MSLKEFLNDRRKMKAVRRLDKLTRRLCEKYGQNSERYAAADELAEINTEDALYGLLQRFNIQTPQIIEDEEEKQYIFELILQRGEIAVPAIHRYIKEKENLAFPLQLLTRIAGAQKTKHFLLEMLRDYMPEYDRVPEKKIDIIQALGEFKDQEIVDSLLPFLQDPQDDVVISAIDIVSKYKEHEDQIRTLLLELFVDDEEKPRIKRHILETMKELHWKVAGYRKKVQNIIKEPYYLDKKGFIKRKGEE